MKGEAIRICFPLILRIMKYMYRLRKETIWIFQRFDFDMRQTSTTNHYENDFLQQETIGDYRTKKRPKNKKQKLFKEAVHFENDIIFRIRFQILLAWSYRAYITMNLQIPLGIYCCWDEIRSRSIPSNTQLPLLRKPIIK